MADRKEKTHEIQRRAEALLGRGIDWATFYREVLGLQGIVRRSFATPQAREKFERTTAYQQLQQMLTGLRREGPRVDEGEEPTRMITIRVPKSMHEALKVEAHEHHTTMNKLCISKLLQFIDREMVPPEAWVEARSGAELE